MCTHVWVCLILGMHSCTIETVEIRKRRRKASAVGKETRTDEYTHTHAHNPNITINQLIKLQHKKGRAVI